MPSFRVIPAALGLGLVLWPATSAVANVFDDVARQIEGTVELLFPEPLRERKMEFSVGVGTLAVPDYEGSDDYRLRPLPYFEFRWGDTVSLRVNELKVALTNSPVRAGTVISLDFGRNADDNPALAGVGGIGTAVEAGGFIQAAYQGWVGEIQLRHDIADGHEGTIGKIGVGRYFKVNQRLRILAGTLMHWADGNYMDRVFGISSDQAAASGLPAYDPDGGIRDIGARVIAVYRASERLTVNTGIGFDRYLGDPADSPLVAGSGSANQFAAGVVLSYLLWSKEATP